MCGRFVVACERKDLIDLFELEELAPGSEIFSHNIAPSQQVSIVVEREIEGMPARQMHAARWGLLPAFAKDMSGPPLFNARIETVLDKPSFKEAALLKRCVIPASGYFEWTQTEPKTPTYIYPPEGMLGFAGIYWWWRDPQKESGDPARWVLTCSILTKDAAPNLAAIHDRSPVMLSPDSLAAWLAPDFETSPELLAALQSESDEVARELSFHEVSKTVGNVSNDSPELILAI